MVEPRVAEEVAKRSRHARLVVPRTEYHTVEPREDDRPGTHRAGLQGHVQRAPLEPVRPGDAHGVGHGPHLGVRQSAGSAHGIRGARDGDALTHDHRPDGHFTARTRRAGEREGLTHPAFVVGRAGSAAGAGDGHVSRVSMEGRNNDLEAGATICTACR